MGFSIPNYQDAQHPYQSAPDSVDFKILADGIASYGVVSGCGVTSSVVPDMNLQVAAGDVLLDGVVVVFAGGSISVDAADVTHPRIDMIASDVSGTPYYIPGTPSVVPVMAGSFDECVILATVYVDANVSSVSQEDIVDKRVFLVPTSSTFEELTDVDTTGKVPGSIFHWDAVDGTYNPSPLNVASDGTTDLVASQDTDVLRLHIGSSPAVFSVSASNDGEDTSQQLQVNATGVYVNALLVATEAAASGIAASAVSTHAGATDPHGDRAYADGLFASNDALLFKGVIDCSANPDYPAASAGHTYKISVAGKLGGASGVSVEVGDTAICAVDNTLTGSHALVGANWFIIQANLDGAVTGPASSTSGNVATFSGTGGKVIQDSGVALGNAASKNVGTTAGTVAAGDDSRLSDTRTPSDDSVTSAKIVNGSVTNTDMADMAAKTVKMRHTNSTGAPEDTSMANLLADASGQAGADFSFNTHKVTGVTEGAAAGEAATYAATPAGIVTAKGDLIFGTGSHTAARSAAPTNNKFWCADSNQSNGFTAVDLPWLQKVDVLRDLPYSATGFASQLALAGNYAQMTALNDEAVFYLQFGAGTWSFNCWRTAFSSYGILTCSIDGTTIATLDNYSSGSINPGQSTTTGISITVPGVYAFKIKTTSKNASSSGYNQRIWGLSFTRTA